MRSYSACLPLSYFSEKMSSRSFHMDANSRIPFLLVAEEHCPACTHHILSLFTCLWTLRPFPCLGAVNNAAIDIGCRCLFDTWFHFLPFKFLPSPDFDESACGVYSFNVLRALTFPSRGLCCIVSPFTPLASPEFPLAPSPHPQVGQHQWSEQNTHIPSPTF